MSLASLSFSVQIAASREDVWKVITEGYPQWIAAVVGEGAQTKGAWEKNSEIEFLAPKGKGGMVAQISECEKPARIQWNHHSMIREGNRMTFSDMGEQGKMMEGMSERYELSERDNGVLLEATIQCPQMQRDGMQKMWPAGLEKIKELAEATEVAGSV